MTKADEVQNRVEYVDISLLKKSNKNPRVIKNRNFSKLCESLKKDPKFLELRPILVDKNYEIYAGTQRYSACLISGWKKVPVIVTDVDEKTKDERMLRDNLHSGDFDLAMLKDKFDNDMVKDVFDDDKLFDNLDKPKEEVTYDDKYVENMELKNFESHDYIVFAFDDYRDFIFALQKLGIGKVNSSFSPTNKKIGIGRVVNGQQLVELLRR